MEKKIFDDIDKLDLGDKFYIYNLDNVLTYEVDNIQIVGPNDIEAIIIDDEKDFVTLLTCTAYDSASHRLLVRGQRVEKENEQKIESEQTAETENLQYNENTNIEKIKNIYLAKFIVATVVVIGIIIIVGIFIFKKEK